MRFARNAVYSGVMRLRARDGDELAMTLYDDDEEDPAPVTSVVDVVAFAEGALAIGHSTVTEKVYLYHLNADLTGWYDESAVLTLSLAALPVGVLWEDCPDRPAVSIAEGLGTAYIAHNAALTAASLDFPTRTFDGEGTIEDLEADLDGTGAKKVYFLGVASFQQQLFGFGFNKSDSAAVAYRPEQIRHSAPNYGGLAEAGSGSFTVGHKVRSARERVTTIVTAGEVCYFGLNRGLWGMLGEGRDSFQKVPLHGRIGIAGLKSACDAGGRLYAWSHRGPVRTSGLQAWEPLWSAIPETVKLVTNPQKVVAVYDDEIDQVRFFYEMDGALKAFASFDVERDVWLGPDSAIGIGIACAAVISPVFGAAVAGPAPADDPAVASTTNIGTTVATANWTPGDLSASASTILELRRQGTVDWTVVDTVPSMFNHEQLTGLLAGVAYEWRVRHLKNGQYSAYLGPEAGTQFTTATGGTGGGEGGPQALNPPTAFSVIDQSFPGFGRYLLTWENAGEVGASTEIYRYGPSAVPPPSQNYALIMTCAPGVASFTEHVTISGKYWIKIRHVKSGVDASDYAGPLSVDAIF
jgi:hypothetical protein